MYPFFAGRQLSFEHSPFQRDERSDHLTVAAAGVRQNIPGEATGESWLLAVHDPFGFAAGLLALWDAGCIAVLSADTRPDTLKALLPSVRGIISDEDLPALPLPVIKFPWPLTAAPLIIREQSGDDVAVRLFTSGSTGAPKMVPKTFRQLFEEVRNIDDNWGGNTFALPHYTTVSHLHIYGLLFNILWPLSTGRVLPRSRSLYWEEILSGAAETGAVIISSPPHLRFLPDIAEGTPFNWAASRLFSSGGPLAREVALRIERVTGGSPMEIYGSTETGGIGFRRQSAASDGLFSPFSGVSLRSAEDQQLEVRSPWLSDIEWTATGDRGRMEPDNRFCLLGRADTIVKIAGKRVSVTEMMASLDGAPDIVESRVFQIDEDNEDSRSALAAVLRVSSAKCAQLESDAIARRDTVLRLRRWLETQFESVVIPRTWRFIAEWPVDERGKVSAAALRDLVRHE